MTRLRRLRGRRGATLPIVGLMLFVLMAFASIGVDMAWLYVRKQAHVNAADAAARAAAVGLPSGERSQELATAAAIASGVDPAGMSVSYLGNGEFQVTTREETPLFFGRIFGMDSVPVGSGARAVSRVSSAIRGRFPAGVKPWGLDVSAFHAAEARRAGTLFTLRLGLRDETGQILTPGDLYPVQLGRTSGQERYLEDLRLGTDGTTRVGQYLPLEPGDLTDSTLQAIRELQERASTAPWSDQTWETATVQNPRVLLVPVVDWYHVGNGGTTVGVQGFAALYIEELSGAQLTARFLRGIHVPNGEVRYDGRLWNMGVRTVRLTE